MITFLQINVGVGRAAQDLALATADKRKADILLISEQYRSGTEPEGWFPDSNNRAAILVRSQIPINLVGPQENGFRWIEVPGLRVYSCYWSPNCRISDYEDFVLRLERSIRASVLPCVVAGDFNAKSRIWGSPTEDQRGTILSDLVAALDLTTCNNGDSPTFVRGQSKSFIDITFTSNTIRGKVHGWCVLDSESLSLHKFICFSVRSTPPRGQVEDLGSSGWRTRSLNAELFATALGITPLVQYQQSVDCDANNLVKWMAQAADTSVPRRKGLPGKLPVPWWNREIGLLRGECNKARRKYQRSRKRLGEDRSREPLERW